MDQAQRLREFMNRHHVQEEKKQPSRMITITSGKGGVGKSNFTLNFALALKEAGKKVVILDLDLSTANIDILMGATAKLKGSLADVMYQKKYLFDCIEKGIGGIDYIAGGLDIQELMKLDQKKLIFFMNQIQELNSYADFILLDTGAGISKMLVDFILASDETIMVTTPEPTSIADAYSVMKAVHQFTVQPPKFRLVVNRAKTYREAVDTSRALKNASSVFLKMNLNTLGFLMEDEHVGKAVRSQTPFYLSYPNCEASKNIKQIMYTFLPDMEGNPSSPIKGIRGFFEKILFLRKS
ncbi:MinD/ParA family protein [Neobacillus mesonae]|uniref:MinD/ParA family protein n=1 Tax=Neobacillus mesonae TaxID=1193713 RepID=UPI0020424765|nr:MinD/ParA family protein [Neobacillus mesonae]MCM3569579.1 MinD/ParA family protein [Neobacillus mesonae]